MDRTVQITITRDPTNFSPSSRWVATLGSFKAYGLYPRTALDNLLNMIVESSLEVVLDLNPGRQEMRKG